MVGARFLAVEAPVCFGQPTSGDEHDYYYYYFGARSADRAPSRPAAARMNDGRPARARQRASGQLGQHLAPAASTFVSAAFAEPDRWLHTNCLARYKINL